MKKFLMIFAMMVIIPTFESSAGNYTGYNDEPSYSHRTVRKSGYKGKNVFASENRQTYSRTYSTDENSEYVTTKKRKESYSTSAKRKYFLAHPFFQPLKGKFGSVTDFAYATNSFDFNLTNNSEVPTTLIDFDGKYTATQYLVKEDFSFGITDKLAFLLMGQYDYTKSKFSDWKHTVTGETSDQDENINSGVNIYGLGLQYRFVDNNDWIGMLAGYFQYQKDTTNTLFLDVKAGYKVSRTTLYGTLRGMRTNLLSGDTYGAYVENDKNWLMLAYKSGIKDLTMIEGGLGVFSVLGEDWTANFETIYAGYDWHNQMYLKGGFGWQPGEHFALNLYGQVSIYDSAKDQTLNAYYPVTTSTGIETQQGEYKIKNYNEWKAGLQAILYF